MNPELIEINRTLYKGLKAQALSQLDMLPEAQRSTEAALWLRAHAQSDENACAQQLGDLANRFPKGQYGAMAREALQRETPYVKVLAVQPARRGVLSRVSIAGFLFILGALMAVSVGLGALVSTLNQVNAPSVVNIPTTVLDPLLKVPLLTDHSQPLSGDPHQAYAAGVLHITAVEDASLRVASGSSGNAFTLATPILKTHFYALRAAFECKLNTCEQPPQAEVLLILQDGSQVKPEDGLLLADGKDERMQAIGKNGSTSGWFIFQIAQGAKAQAVRIIPVLANGSTGNVTPQVYNIQLP